LGIVGKTVKTRDFRMFLEGSAEIPSETVLGNTVYGLSDADPRFWCKSRVQKWAENEPISDVKEDHFGGPP